jgi:glycosyltransferase involved in cell wall biosynthesis
MKPLRIVMAMIEPPLPFGSAPARWYYVLLKGLVERGHRVTAVAACSRSIDMEKAAQLFTPPHFDLRCYAHPTRRGLLAKLETLMRPYSYMFSPALRQDLQSQIDQGFDVLHLEQLWCGWLALHHCKRALVNVHHLAMIDLAEIRPRTFEHKLMFRAERRLLSMFKWFRACSPRLGPLITEINQSALTATVPVGIDASLYPYVADRGRVDLPIVTLVASMGWYPGLSAAKRLLTRLYPAIKRRIPDTRLEVVGWSARSALGEFSNLPGVSIYENVPDTVPYFHRAGVFLYAPARGSGMKVKVLEAMALGAPVVTTSEGVEGLSATDGVHAGIADDDEGLVERTVALLCDRDRQNRQRAAARELIETFCSPSRTVEMIEQIYSRMLAS